MQNRSKVNPSTSLLQAGVCALALGGICLAGGALVSQAAAQVAGPVPIPDQTAPVGAPERVPVLQRPRPEFDPVGARVGGFVVKPSLEVSESLDTNVFVTRNNEKSDFITSLAPSLSVVSDFSRHELAFLATGDIRRYARYGSQDADNFITELDGRYDIARDTYFSLGGGYQQLHEDRGSADAFANQLNPTEYHVASGHLGFNYTPRRIGVVVNTTVDRFDFENVQSTTGGTLTNTDRNRTEYAITPRLLYEIVPAYRAFIQATGNKRDYDQKFDVNGLQRSSTGYSAAIGTDFQLTPLINGEVYVGYQHQDYDDPRLKPIDGPTFGGNVLWNVTGLTSLLLNFSRTVQETTQVGASGFQEAQVGLTVQHELLRNVLLTGGLSYLNDDYSGITRTDDFAQGTLTAQYLFSRNLSAGLSAVYRKRASSSSVNDYDREIYSATVRVQF